MRGGARLTQKREWCRSGVRALAALLLAWLLPSGAGSELSAGRQAPLRLVRVTPSGPDVPSERQIVFQFDRPVVPLGRMARRSDEIPIRITPDPGCDWRWLDPSALACQLGEANALARSTRYRIRVEPEIETLDGVGLDRPYEHQFITERPKVLYRWFEAWTSPRTPVIRLTLNQAVVQATLSRHLFFRLPRGARVRVKVEEDEKRANTFLLSPQRELPPDTRVELRVEPGIRSRVGPEPSADERALASFRTFPELRFLGVRCTTNEGEEVELAADRPTSPEARRCNPMTPVELLFSAPVLKDVLQAKLRTSPDLAGGRSDFDPWENVRSYSRLSRAPRDDHVYPTPLPRVLLAFERYTLRAPAEDIRDEFARTLDRDLDFAFLTDHRPPRLHLGHRVSVLESQVETHLPVVVTNLEKVHAAYDRLTAAGVVEEEREIRIAEAEDVAYRRALEVRDWLGGVSGAVLGHLWSEPETPGEPFWFFSEVTPFHVHVKIGHYNTLVWVTDLGTGEPVRGAQVEVFADGFERFAEDREILARASTDRRGLALLAGAETLDPERERLEWYWQRPEREHLFVRVEKDGELALVPLAADLGVEARGPNQSWIWSDMREKHGHLASWGATAQGVYRTGDTVQFKIWVRNRGNERLTRAPREGYALQVLDPKDKVVYRVEEVALNEYGSYAGEFMVPGNAAVGWYRFQLEAGFAKRSLEPLRVLVADFTPAPFRVSTELQGESFGPGDSVRVETRARLHAGGPYREADSRVTARLRSTPLRPDDPAAEGFYFETGKAGVVELVHRSAAPLDARGDRSSEFTLPESKISYGSLEVESAVRDDRGKYVAGRRTARFAGRDRYVGILQPDWVLEAGEPAEVRAVVIDSRGRLAPGVPIDFRIERRLTKASRVKGAGNAYVTHYVHSWEEVATGQRVSGSEPAVCEFTPKGPGLHRLSAAIRDSQGRESRSELQRWAMGKGEVLWEEPPGHHLQITPEKEELRVGEKARYLIRNPFPGARALVTIERFGVQKSWLETFEESSEILEFEVEPDFLPGFYLSVVVMSPRVEAPGPGQLEDGAVDLGKPAFRMGYATTRVRDPYKELEIQVEPERKTYKPRETAAVDIQVRTRQGERADAELAVAVLDEAVFDLIATGRRAYDPYQGFYALGELDLRNYNLLTRLVGIQSFEQKGANQGGGGGGAGLRSDFEFVSYWNPSVRPDRKGRARVEFEVPDNLTGWRVLVFGATAEDRMGLGEASFAVNQATEIRPALPNQVVEGDRFLARFTVMNRTEGARELGVSLRAAGSVAEEAAARLSVSAEPYERKPIALPVHAASPGEIRFEIRAGDALDADGLRVALPVGRRSSLQVAASYGSTTEDAVSEPVHFPIGMRSDAGEVSVVASPSVLGGLDGAFRYLADYPYDCWEQRLSKGVMAAHYRALRNHLPENFEWPESEGLPDRVLAQAADYQAPNGGMAYYLPRDEYASPYLSAYTALAFQWLRARGYAVPIAVESRLHAYLQELLRKEVFPDFYSRGMASSVRAVALAALVPSGAVGLEDLERYRRHAAQMDLFGKAWYLSALAGVEGTREMQVEVLDAVLAHATESGGKLVFSETLDDGFARILHTPTRSSCSILSALLALDPELAAVAPGAPFEIVRAITQTRERRDHWENTQENLFCLNALVEYAGAYESTRPDFEVSVGLGDEAIGSARFSDLRDSPREFVRRIRAGDPGRRDELRIARRGTGRLYYAARLFFAPAEFETQRANAGIDVRREYSVKRGDGWQRLESPFRIRAGDLVRVDLYLSLPTARNFVVVDDPVPGGLEPVNRDLATGSAVDADEALEEFPPDAYYFEYDDWRSFAWTRWSFYHRELRHDAARFYSEYLPEGRYHLSYVAQAIAPGEFSVLPVRSEEMYDPDVYGRGLAATLVVEGWEP